MPDPDEVAVEPEGTIAARETSCVEALVAAGEDTALDPERHAREEAERAADPGRLTRAERARVETAERVTGRRSEPPEYGDARPLEGPPTTPLARSLVDAVPEGFALIFEDTDPDGLYVRATFERGDLRISAARYDRAIVDAATTLRVALTEPGRISQAATPDGVCYVLSERDSSIAAWVALPHGDLLLLDASVPLLGATEPPLDRERFLQLVDDAAARLG